jgi:hypothetical protein
MVRLGFYDSEDDLISVIGPLISLLDGSLDIIEQDQLSATMKKNSPAPNEEGGSKKDNSQ